MAALTDEQKREIVEAFACFRTIKEIRNHFRVEHGLDLDTRQIGAYDPLRSYYDAGEAWREVHTEARKKFRESVGEVAAANQSYRLQVLQRGIEKAEEAGNWVLVASLVEQAAKEVGGVLTNQRGLSIDDNRSQKPRDMTPEDRKIALADIIHKAKEHLAAQDPAGTAEGSETVQ